MESIIHHLWSCWPLVSVQEEEEEESPVRDLNRREIMRFSGGSLIELASSVITYRFKSSSDWWEEVNDSPLWQDRIFHTLAGLYGFVAVGALIHYVRIELRVPEYGWTTQKIFHLLNFVVSGVRSILFMFRRNLQHVHPEVFQHVFLDMPSLVFFTTYLLLVLFWVEIYKQALAESTDGLRRNFCKTNAKIYSVQIILWLILWWKPISAMLILSKVYLAGVWFFASKCFLLDGGKLFLLLLRFPVESIGRRKKLLEVGCITTICFSCFLTRCIMMIYYTFDPAANLDVLNHPVLTCLYYLLVEILPAALVLFILRKLPPERGIAQHHPIV